MINALDLEVPRALQTEAVKQKSDLEHAESVQPKQALPSWALNVAFQFMHGRSPSHFTDMYTFKYIYDIYFFQMRPADTVLVYMRSCFSALAEHGGNA